jgi:hypothetical protein
LQSCAGSVLGLLQPAGLWTTLRTPALERGVMIGRIHPEIEA